MHLALLIFLASLGHSEQAQDLTKLEKATMQIGSAKFQAYVADDENKRSTGLMYIKKIPENEGMLFVFEQLQPLNFWMKNTLIPLDIGFFDGRGVLIDVQAMKIAGSLMEADPPSYQSRGPALFALEMNVGWFARHKIKTGAALHLVSRSRSALLLRQLPDHGT